APTDPLQPSDGRPAGHHAHGEVDARGHREGPGARRQLLHHQALQRPRPRAQASLLPRGPDAAAARTDAVAGAMSRALRFVALAFLLASPAVAQWRSGGSEIPLEGDGRVWTVRAKLNDS